MLSIAASGVLWLTRNRHREVVPYATAVLAGLGLFFTCLMLFADGANPFERLDPVPAEGAGLNPLLRHPAMAVHPPMLYSGYVLWSIPFAFAVGALITRRVDASWIRSTRRFALDARGLSSASASCSAPSGPMTSSAGAGTGAGTRSRTRR